MTVVADPRRNNSKKRVANNLVALSSAAVLAVYSAGYLRTRAAAERLAGAAGPPRTVLPDPRSVAAPPEAERPATPAPPAPRTAARTRPKPPAKVAASPKPAPVETPTASPVSPPAAVAAAPAEVKPPEPEPKPEPKPAPYKDGTYYGWGTSRHGDIQAAVVIERGRITSASIAQCLTRYSCSWIAALPPQVVSRQSAEVDFVSGATQSTNAFYYAVLEALALAKAK
jgi:uncharacterized protein with FMN-binding domain